MGLPLMKKLKTVGDLKRAIESLPDDLLIEVYENNGINRAVTLMHVFPDEDEKKDGSYEVLCICHDTLV